MSVLDHLNEEISNHLHPLKSIEIVCDYSDMNKDSSKGDVDEDTTCRYKASVAHLDLT